MPGKKSVSLLLTVGLLWSPVGVSISVLRLSAATDHCRLTNSTLSCDFTGVGEPVYAEDGYLENIDSVECRGPPVLHLPENACIKTMKIQHTKKVVVTGRSWKRNCGEYHLVVKNSTMTALPLTTTHLHAVGSTFYKMKLHPKMKHVSVANSRVSVLAIDQFLKDSVMVNITNTTVYYVDSLTASKKAEIQFWTSDIAYMRLDKTALQDNASLVMVDSRVGAGDTQELLVPPGVRQAQSTTKSPTHILLTMIISSIFFMLLPLGDATPNIPTRVSLDSPSCTFTRPTLRCDFRGIEQPVFLESNPFGDMTRSSDMTVFLSNAKLLILDGHLCINMSKPHLCCNLTP
ncbi:hypothetical protein C7M84_009189 [Penaeus vannamei]|uniref:Uncharacterized protein n=1 Tax=Penaeus vannamei TaxID=6689 RepID=A0A3R7PNS8_PENVA|nr:hypothetical protein C7M84_009189 [Penaeus vannamei]